MQVPRAPGPGPIGVTGATGYRERPLLRQYLKVPGRPTASVRLWFDPELPGVMATVTEGVNIQALFRYAGDEFEWAARLGWQKREDLFEHLRCREEPEIVCWLTLLFSDCFCANQAIVDLPKFKDDAFWTQILEDARHDYAAAIVMMM